MCVLVFVCVCVCVSQVHKLQAYPRGQAFGKVSAGELDCALRYPEEVLFLESFSRFKWKIIDRTCQMFFCAVRLLLLSVSRLLRNTVSCFKAALINIFIISNGSNRCNLRELSKTLTLTFIVFQLIVLVLWPRTELILVHYSHSFRGEAPLIPVKAARWHMKLKQLDPLALTSTTKLATS